MYLHIIRNQFKTSFKFWNSSVRNLSVNSINSQSVQAATAQSTYIDREWDNALPFEKIPGPSAWKLFRAFLPGGRYHDLDMPDMAKKLYEDYGDIMHFPGMFDRSGFVFVYDPSDFEKVIIF